MTADRRQKINRTWTLFIMMAWVFTGTFIISARAATYVHENLSPKILIISGPTEIFPSLQGNFITE